jgi:hypothetical protein
VRVHQHIHNRENALGLIPKISRRLMVLPLVIVLGFLAWIFFHARVSEPEYEGRRLTSWLRGYRYSFSGPQADEVPAEKLQARLQARNAVRHLGTNSLPIFLDMLQAHDGPLKQKALPVIRKYSPASFYPFTEDEKLNMALIGFKILGPIAKSAVPALLVMLRDKDSDKYPRKKILAMAALARIGPAAEDAVPVLTDCLKDQEEAVRSAATNALQAIVVSLKTAP